jgi:hypothetical protein
MVVYLHSLSDSGAEASGVVAFGLGAMVWY